MDDLFNGEAFPISEVKNIGPLTSMERLEGQDMSLGDVYDMNVIPNTGSIGSVVVGSINRDLAPFLQQGHQHSGDEVGFRMMILAYEAIRIGASGVKIP